jgi:hypothetical protein
MVRRIKMANQAHARIGKCRDIREELRQLVLREFVMPGAVAREIGTTSEVLEDWLADHSRLDGALFDRLNQFIDDRIFVQRVMDEGSTELRRQYAAKLIGNVMSLLCEMERCTAESRADARDQANMYLRDLKHVIDLLGDCDARLPELLATALRGLLGPGDRLLISRGGGVDARERENK